MPRRAVFWSLAAAAIAAAVAQTWALRWTCDDAFISFRYAQHFADGHGLVFNLDPDEAPVEGYTNFAWTMWLALGVALGCTDRALETWSIVSGIAAHAGTVLLLASIAWRASGGRALVPVAACGYAALHHAASLAPAGLETALFALLVTALLRGCLALRCVRDAWLLGFLGVLAALTRPDGALPVAAAGAFVAWDAWRRRAPALLTGYAVPFALVFAPYLGWRRAFYGHWVPNTFYAKSGGDPMLGQGLAYLGGFFACYWALAVPAALLAMFLVRKPDLLAGVSAYYGRRPWLAIAAFVVPYLGFVAWVGGDFMFARFVLPVLPALLLAADFACLRWRAPWLQVALAAVLVLGGSVGRVEPPGLDDFRAAVSDNRRISVQPLAGVPLTEIARNVGEYWQRLFAGLDVRLGIAGAHAMLAYYARVPVAVECASGLTDAYIAHLPIPRRGKPGHERPYPLYPGYLERRGVHFMCETSFGDRDAWRMVQFPVPPLGMPVRLVTWDRELMAELARRDPGIVFTDFEAMLDAYIAALPGKTKEQVRADYAKFRAAWFDHADDPVRRRAFDAFLR